MIPSCSITSLLFKKEISVLPLSSEKQIIHVQHEDICTTFSLCKVGLDSMWIPRHLWHICENANTKFSFPCVVPGGSSAPRTAHHGVSLPPHSPVALAEMRPLCPWRPARIDEVHLSCHCFASEQASEGTPLEWGCWCDCQLQGCRCHGVSCWRILSPQSGSVSSTSSLELHHHHSQTPVVVQNFHADHFLFRITCSQGLGSEWHSWSLITRC